MQLGARWSVGTPPHRSVPASLHEAIAEQEAAHPEARSWTLTWLEGRPRCALEDLVIVGLDTDGAVTTMASGTAAADRDVPGADDEDDDWLS